MARVTTIAVMILSVVPSYFAGQANLSTVAAVEDKESSISLTLTADLAADIDVPEEEKQLGQVHPLPQICGGRRCYQHYAEALRCCPGYRCSFRLPFLGGMCIRDLDGGTNHLHHEGIQFTEAPPPIEHTHSSLKA